MVDTLHDDTASSHHCRVARSCGVADLILFRTAVVPVAPVIQWCPRLLLEFHGVKSHRSLRISR